MSAFRDKVAAFVEHQAVQRTVIGLIILNAIIIGMETSAEIMHAIGHTLELINTIIIAIFVVEIVLRIYAEGARFWRSGWNWFDFLVVVMALIPASSTSQVLRVLRILRVLRLLSVIRSMRLVVESLAAAMPGVASIAGLLAIVLYVFSVMSTMLFGHDYPEQFGSLGLSFVQHFRLMLGDGWPDVVFPVAQDTSGWTWFYFIVFTIISTMVVLNLLIGVIVEAVDRSGHEIDEHPLADGEAVADDAAATAPADTAASAAPGAGAPGDLSGEIAALRSEIAALREALGT